MAPATKLYYFDFINRVRTGNIERFLTFYGEETFLKDYAIGELKKSLFPEDYDTYRKATICYVGEDKLTDILNLSRNLPMFASKNLIIVRNCEKLKDKSDAEILKAFYKNPPKKCWMIFDFSPSFNRNLNKNKAFVKILSRNTSEYYFIHFRDWALEKFIFEYAAAHGYNIDNLAIKILIDRMGGRLELIVQELEKLDILIGHSQYINKEHIDKIVYRNPLRNIFDLQNAFASRNIKQIILFLNTLFDSGRHQLYVVSMMTSFIQKVLQYKALSEKGKNDSQICNAMKILPFQLKSFVKTSSNYKRIELWYALSLLSKAEELFKSARVNPLHYLEVMFYKICTR